MPRPPDPLKVLAVRSFDPDSGDFTVEFETKTGQRFTCFAFAVEFQPGEEITDAQFSVVDGGAGIEEVFAGNPDRTNRVENTGEWSCRAWGQIVALSGPDALVDCGGVLIPLTNLTHDETVIGEWVGFSVDRLDVFRDREAS
jgi:hypothetical protein